MTMDCGRGMDYEEEGRGVCVWCVICNSSKLAPIQSGASYAGSLLHVSLYFISISTLNACIAVLQRYDQHNEIVVVVVAVVGWVNKIYHG
jgi:hypothetical protein